ncbi:MAG: thioredoxin-disulfide reductase [Candidatus Coatesbacteria bacterium]|nr:thioredoxin-disulfide reductase [Candidatus Coatesbacteria bacterium]
MSEQMYELAIIGGGPAGHTAAIYAKRGGVNFVIFNDGLAGGQIATTATLENYPGVVGPIAGVEFSQLLDKQAEQIGFEVEPSRIEKIREENDHFMMIDDFDDTWRAKAILLATGAHYRPFPLKETPQYHGRGLSYCATCDGNFFRDQEVAVVGGGDTALEDALYLSRICKKVYLVHRRLEFRGQPVLQWQVRGVENIELVMPYTPQRILGEEGVEGLVVKHKKSGEERRLQVTGIFSALGLLPNNELVEGMVEMTDYGYVKVDQRMRTSHPRIFAAGDVVDSPLRQIAVAVGQAAIATETARCWINENCAIEMDKR